MRFKLRRGLKWLGRRLPGALLFAAIAAVFLLGLDKTAAAQRRETAENLELSIRRAAMVCYALEGRYPESLAYLKDNYSIMIDEEDFTVHYYVFASNILPEITVIEK